MSKEQSPTKSNKSIKEKIKEQEDALAKVKKEYEMEINIEHLQIVLNTNISSRPSIDFTSDIIHISEDDDFVIDKSKLSKYPFLCTNYKYPSSALMALSYEAIVKFFFIKDDMITHISKAGVVKDDKHQQVETEKYNIQLMMKLLFPTKFFIAKNLHQSIDKVVGGNTFPHSLFFNPNQLRHSYIDMGREIYTISRVTWVNDLLNHDEFNSLIKKSYFVNKSLREGKILSEKQALENELSITKLSSDLKKVYKDGIKAIDQFVEKKLIPCDLEIFKEEGSTVVSTVDEISMLGGNEPTKSSKRIDRYTVNNYDTKIEDKSEDFIARIVEGEEYTIDDFNTLEHYLGIKVEDIKTFMELTTEKNGDSDDETTEVSEVSEEYEVYNVKESEKKKFQSFLLMSIKNNFKEQRNQINQINKQLEDKKVTFNFTPMPEKLTEPIEAHNIYLHNALQLRTGVRFTNTYIQKFYDNTLPKYIRTKERRDKELTNGNNKFKDLLYGKMDGIQEEPALFYDTMSNIYKKYIMNDNNVQIDNERDLLYTGVDYVFHKYDSTKLPRRRVFFIVDLIEGEVNDSNKSTIYCPYSGEYLGELYEHIFNRDEKLSWKAMPADYAYSVKKEAIEKSKSKPTKEEDEQQQVEEEIKQDEIVDWFQPEKKVKEKKILFDEEKFDYFWGKIITQNIQSMFDEFSRELGTDPHSKTIDYVKKYEKEIDPSSKLKLLRNDKKGLLQELSKYYSSEHILTGSNELKTQWNLHKKHLMTLKDITERSIDNLVNNDIGSEDEKKLKNKNRVLTYLTAIIEQAEEIIPAVRIEV
jgi:hypothetical protein